MNQATSGLVEGSIGVLALSSSSLLDCTSIDHINSLVRALSRRPRRRLSLGIVQPQIKARGSEFIQTGLMITIVGRKFELGVFYPVVLSYPALFVYPAVSSIGDCHFCDYDIRHAFPNAALILHLANSVRQTMKICETLNTSPSFSLQKVPPDVFLLIQNNNAL